MKLKICKNTLDKFSKTISISKKYVVTCSGKSVVIYDKQFNRMKEYNNLAYVYTAKISPNEKKLALISNANKFYIINLEDFSIAKYSTYKEYNYNLEGRGCWGNNDDLYVLVESKITHKSCIRKYSIAKGMTYVDLFPQKYRLLSIALEPASHTLIVIGHDIEKAMCGNDDYYRLILFNGQTFIDYNLEKEDDVIVSSDYNAITKSITLYGLSKTWSCNLKGEKIRSIKVPKTSQISFDSSKTAYDIFSDEQFKAFADLLNLEFSNFEDYITKIVVSWDKKYYFIGTRFGLSVVNAKNNIIEDQVSIQYGVADIVQFSENILFISTWNKLKVYEIT